MGLSVGVIGFPRRRRKVTRAKGRNAQPAINVVAGQRPILIPRRPVACIYLYGQRDIELLAVAPDLQRNTLPVLCGLKAQRRGDSVALVENRAVARHWKVPDSKQDVVRLEYVLRRRNRQQ